MRIGNIAGRAQLIVDGDCAVDIGTASRGQFGPGLAELYERWEEFRKWSPPADAAARSYTPDELDNPAPAPRQIFGVGLNYCDHAAEAGAPAPEEPLVFTKFLSSLAAPVASVPLPPGKVDWEVELVLVIGRAGRHIPEDAAWQHIAGVAVGQDLSERQLQSTGPMPQFNLAKSFPGFTPIGPVVVTPDEFEDRDDLELGCSINGEAVQKGRTSNMIFPIPPLIAKLSAVVELLPGDVIFTGTPAGVGVARTPQRFLSQGDELVSYVTGVGEIRQTFVTAE
ncbi:fumarylacetoacetate hydrolase [Streptomyces libani subsp. rufus]|nr:fumarylacetoacetate hydrolase [Streptomyces libani subsp. rufus]